jgi:hypothetical protein
MSLIRDSYLDGRILEMESQAERFALRKRKQGASRRRTNPAGVAGKANMRHPLKHISARWLHV